VSPNAQPTRVEPWLSVKYRLGGIFQAKEFVEAGGFMSYGADTLDLFDERHPTSIAS
jgi:hypothetical protein